jgi:hypothetical protein
MPVIASTIVAVPVIARIITVAPVWPVIPPVVAIPGITVVGIGVVIARPVICGEGNRESKGKVNTGARRRFREERQSSDRKNEDNELLHKKRDERNVSQIQEIVSSQPAASGWWLVARPSHRWSPVAKPWLQTLQPG